MYLKTEVISRGVSLKIKHVNTSFITESIRQHGVRQFLEPKLNLK